MRGGDTRLMRVRTGRDLSLRTISVSLYIPTMQDSKKPYDIDLDRFKNHRRVIPWMLIVKVVLAVALIWFIFYTMEEMANQQENQQKQQETEIEVELSE